MSRILRVAAVAGLVLIAAPGCNRWSSPSTGDQSVSDTEGGSETEAESPDTGSDSPDDKREWARRVRQELSDSPETPREPAEESSRSAGCTLFPDSCGKGQTCVAAIDGSRRCEAFDPDKSPGDPCGAGGRCNAGQQCVGDDPPICLTACQMNGPELFRCPEGRACSPVIGSEGRRLAWGVCRPTGDRCVPWPNDSCTIGEACVETAAGRRCRTYRESATLGEACVRANDCRIGQVCVIDESGLGACRARCDDEHPCAGAECRPLKERDFGFCPGTAGRASSESPSIIGY